jgi:hypothetical protein
MPAADQIDYAALAEQARAANPVTPPAAAPPAGAGLAPTSFVIVNGQRVPVEDADPMTPGVITRIGAPGIVPPPAVDYAKLADQAREAHPAAPADPSLWEKANTSPLHPYFEAARQSIVEHMTAPTLSADPVSAGMRGGAAGISEGLLNVAESFTTPTGFALWLTGLGAESAAVKAIPALKPLIALPAVQALRVAVHGTAGAAFAAHGAGQAAEGASTIYDAATSATPPPEGRLEKALGGAGQIGQGAIEMAGGALGMHSAYQTAQPAIAAWQQTRRTAAGAAALDDFRKAAPPSVAAPYTTDELQRGYSLILRDHVTNQPITTIAEGIAAADNQIGRLEDGFNALIAKDPTQLITTKPLAAARAALSTGARSTDVAKGLANLETLDLDKPLTVFRANDIRQRLNAENAAELVKSGYDVAKAREVDPAFAAREAAVASLRDGIHDVLDARAQQTPGFTRDLRLDEGAVIAVRNALLRQQYRNDARVGGTGRTSLSRKIIAGAVRATGVGVGGAGGAAIGGVPGAVGGGIVGGVIAEPIAHAVDQPPLTRDALIERSFQRASAPGTSLQTTPAGPVAPGATGGAPGGSPIVPGIVPSGSSGPGGASSAGPGGAPPPPAAGSPQQIAVKTFLALRASGYSREQAVQTAASYARQTAAPTTPPVLDAEIVPDPSLPPGPPPRAALPPAPSVPLGPGARTTTPNLATFTDDALRYAAEQGIPTYAAAARAEIARRGGTPPATIGPDAAAAVADQSGAAARAGDVAPGGGPQLPAPAGERVLAPAERAARARVRAAARADTRAAADAEEQQGLSDLVAKAQAAGYPGDPAALRAELADRLQGIKDLHAEFDDQGTNGITLLKAIAANGGLSEPAAAAAGHPGELRWLKEMRDTAPTTRQNAGNLAARRVLDTVRGVKGVFRDATEMTRGGRAGGQDLGGMLDKLRADGRFTHLANTNDLAEAIRAAAMGRAESRNALADLAATSHDLIGTATIHPEDDLSFDPATLEAESQAHAAAPARAKK